MVEKYIIDNVIIIIMKCNLIEKYFQISKFYFIWYKLQSMCILFIQLGTVVQLNMNNWIFVQLNVKYSEIYLVKTCTNIIYEYVGKLLYLKDRYVKYWSY